VIFYNIHLPNNFNAPFKARNMQDYWQRHHITLSRFLGSYVFRNVYRKGSRWRNFYVATMVTFLVSGIWHGAGWNFIVWGLWFGFFVAMEKYTLLRWKRFPVVLSRILALAVVYIGWGIFYFEDFSRMTEFYRSLFMGAGDTSMDATVLLNNGWLLLVALILCLPVGKTISSIPMPKWSVTVGKSLVSILILLISAALLVGATNNAFIYTRF
jgi:alginate O-acetyltransferase complex protein AlgI